MDVTINGKRVTLREKLAARDNWDMVQGFGDGVNLSDMSFETATGIFRRFVESWEYEGDPALVESYAELDLFREYMPLMQAVSERISALMGSAKN